MVERFILEGRIVHGETKVAGTNGPGTQSNQYHYLTNQTISRRGLNKDNYV
jgi:hypothetical protein